MTEGRDDRRAALDAERAVNEQYRQRLGDLADRAPAMATGTVIARNQQWTVGGVRPPVSAKIAAPLVGRVSLDCDDDLLGTGFYIGSWHQEWDGLQVVSWAAPISCLFYNGRAAADELAVNVCGQRTFIQRGSDLYDFDDEINDGRAWSEVFPTTRATLNIETPEAPVRRPVRSRPQPHQPMATPSTALDPPELARTASASRREKAKESPVEPAKPELRAERAVRDAISRPKTGRLSSVLSTLQPDQYRLVTWPDTEPLIVQGQPGTGKTVIATHRAAYLTHPDREPKPLRRVVIIGPTEQYEQHVSATADALGDTKVGVFALPTLLRQQAHADPSEGDPDVLRLDTEWRVGSLLDRSARALHAVDALGTEPRGRQRRLIDALRTAAEPVRHLLETDEELAEWCRELPPWESVRKLRRFLPFLAAADQAANGLAGERFEHLILDEAQDLRPLEWKIVTSYLIRDGGMSIFGDMHQRHSDFSPMDWAQVAAELSLLDDDGQAPVQELGIGYRSTQQILRFANQLLPAKSRRAFAIQEGTSPRVVKVTGKDLLRSVASEGTDLAARHREGMVAVITMNPTAISDHLRASGWGRGDLRHSWTSSGTRLVVLSPETARGLEFDGVVVVEPSDFPANVGRMGPLYTSLTRATKELTVVYAKALPRNLRVR